MRADLRLSLTAAVAAVALAASTAPALAEDTPTVGIGRAVTEDAQRGSFKVTAWSDAPSARITTVSARIRQGDTVLADIPALTADYSWDPALANTFRLPAEAALKLVEDGGTMPALGTYSIDVTATDSLGNKLTRTDAGQLDFRLRPEFRNFTLSKPTYADRTTRPSGTLVGIQPGSGDVVQLTGQSVSIRQHTPQESPEEQTVTDGTGAFTGGSYPISSADLEGRTDFSASVSADTAELHGTVRAYDSVSEWVPRKVTVTATADKKRALSGQTVTISGRMTDPAAGNAPVANEQVRVRIGTPSPTVSPPAIVRTGADGRFTARLVAASGEYVGGWTVDSPDRYVSFGDVTGPLAIPLESRTDLTSIGLSADGKVTVTGTFRARYVANPSFPVAQYLQLEQSVDGGWKRIATTYVSSAYSNEFTLTAKSRGGWFRVRHLTTDQFAESGSGSFRLARNDTRIVSLNAGPEPVAKGGYVTATGSLQHYWDGAWRAYGNAPVVLQFQPKGSTTWKTVASGRSGSTGKVSLKATASADGSWRIYCFGNYQHFNSPAAAGGDYVDVR
ncbi:hypothetical protein [Streptomyces sp. NRRL B-24572]|uniref:hypothetical protein n=1 Tax=Streptomyces sp. NRRL B-24572 TaxID=1962156 RepID=UPI000A3BD507|nr:hypothetical protein [Streptomyces sp. NRRL B-24572]